MKARAASRTGWSGAVMLALGWVVGGFAGAAEIRVHGLRSVSAGEVMERLNPRLEHVRAKAPSPSRASDAAFLLESFLLRIGFQEPVVGWSIRGNRIDLQVREGLRLELGQVDVPGVDKREAKRLERLFGRPSQERKLTPGDEPPFRAEDLEEGTKLLEADFRSRGYWKARVEVAQQVTDRGRGRVHVFLRVDPGPLHRIGAPRFDGVPGWLVPEMRRRAEPQVGKVADTANLTTLRGEMESAVRSSGHRIDQFKMNRILGKGLLTPRVIVKLGERLRQGELVFVGLEKTRPERVAARFTGLGGEWHDPAEIDRRVRKLLGTGAFSSVQAEGDARDGVIDTTLRLEEGEARGMTYYGGVSSIDGAVFGSRYHDRNLFGRLWNLATGFELAGTGLLGEVRLSNPWFLDSDVHFGGRLFSVTRYYEGYSKFETGLSGEWTHEFDERWSASLLAGASLVNIEPDGIPRPDLGETVYGHHRLRATVLHEARNDRLSPRGGYHAMAALEFGAVAGDLGATYFKAEAGGAWYRELGPGQLNLGLRGGLIQTSATAREFPVDLRYFLGGADTVRSFPYRELGPRAFGGDPVGGEAYWVANAEWVQGLAGLLKGVAFVDAGALGRGSGFSGDAEVAAGVGLRVDLPVGPIRLEYGHNLTQDPGEPGGAFHFAIGIAF